MSESASRPDGRRLFHHFCANAMTSADISLTVLSARAGVSRRRTARAIRVATGMCFRDWRAALLLDATVVAITTDPNMSIKEVWVQLGFGSARAYLRFIRRHTGMTAKCFRSRILAGRLPILFGPAAKVRGSGVVGWDAVERSK